jgi:hypothetical protein
MLVRVVRHAHRDESIYFTYSFCKHCGDAWSLFRLLGRTSTEATNCYMNNCRNISKKTYDGSK